MTLKFPKLLPLLCAAGSLLLTPTLSAVESFETAPSGKFTTLNTEYGKFSATEGNAEIISKAKSGQNSLRLMGGEGKQAELALTTPPKVDVQLSAWAERWSSKTPFSFKITAIGPFGEKEIYDGSNQLKTGGFNTKIDAKIPANTKSVRFSSDTPDGSGVMLDDLYIVPSIPMKVENVTSATEVIPVMIRREFNPVLRLSVKTEGCLAPTVLNDVHLDFTGTTNLKDIESVELFRGEEQAKNAPGEKLGSSSQFVRKNELKLTCNKPLEPGDNHLWVSVKLRDNASLDNKIQVKAKGIFANKKPLKVNDPVTAEQRIGYALAVPGDVEKTNNTVSKFFRIPGMVRSKKGTLIAVYDLRYNHGGDLPANVDVGVRRSTDKGQTWDDHKIAMTCKKILPNDKVSSDGCGDPAILVDESTGRIWIAALWSHGNNSLWGSKTGDNSPANCGQFVLVYSDNDGLTWSEPINITEQIKDKNWALIFQGPGNGICMKDGTLVFPAQYWVEDTDENGNKTNRRGHSTLIYSKDKGKTWHSGTTCRTNTSEAQVIEQKDGSIMINARNEARSGYRCVYVTKDLGKTWEEHPTNSNKDGNGLMEPGACQASIQLVENEGPVKHAFFFSNPQSHSGRKNMTIQASFDEGATWPEKYRHLYDSRVGCGYSALAPIDDKHIGVLYEGEVGYLYFLRFPYKELLQK